MLPDRIARRLTAYVDGELNEKQRKAVLSLLRRSAKARDLLRHLQSDADYLRHLPRPVLGCDIAARVVPMLPGKQALPIRRPLLTSGWRASAWVGLATAAAILLVLGFGVSQYLSTPPQGNLVVKHDPRTAEDLAASVMPGAVDPDPVLIAETLPAPRTDELPPSHPQEDKKMVPVTEIAKAPAKETVAPATPGKAAPAPFGSDISHQEKFKVAELDLPFIRQARELDQEKCRQLLTEELHKGKARRIDLNCQESAVALGRVQTVFQKQGFRVLVDDDVDNRLKLHLRADFALYLDSVSPEEFLAILLQLRNDDREEARRRGTFQFEGLVIATINAEDHRNFFHLLGTDPTVPNAPAPQAASGSPSAKNDAKPAERLALVVAYDLTRTGSISDPLKHFLEGRQERRPGTMPILLVLKKSKG